MEISTPKEELILAETTLDGPTSAPFTEQQLLMIYSALIFIALCSVIILVGLAVYLYRKWYINLIEKQLDKRETQRSADIFEKRVEFFPPSFPGTTVLSFAPGGSHSIVFPINEKSRV